MSVVRTPICKDVFVIGWYQGPLPTLDEQLSRCTTMGEVSLSTNRTNIRDWFLFKTIEPYRIRKRKLKAFYRSGTKDYILSFDEFLAEGVL